MTIWYHSHSHPYHEGKGERRRWLRWPDKQQVIITADPKGEPEHGWLLDRSPGGVCLWSEAQRVVPGTVLTVQSLDEEGRPPDEVRVVNVRRQYGKALLGCSYVRRDDA